MKEKRPILSICIPTCNRADLLNHNLEVLSTFKKERFELIICNNGSSDNTEQIIQKWIDCFPYHNVISHETNILYDRNVASGLKALETEYCMLLGDSTLIDEDSLENLLRELESHSWDAVIIDAFGQLNTQPKVYSDINTLLKEVGWYMSFISASVLSKKMCQDIILKRYFDTQFEHCGVLVEYLCSLDSFEVKLLDNVHIVLNHAGSKKSTSWRTFPFKTFGTDWYNFVMSWPMKVKYETKLKCLKDHDLHKGLFNPWSLFKAKLRGDVKFSDYKEARPILPFVVNAPLWKLDLISIIPSIPPKLVDFIKKINRKK